MSEKILFTDLDGTLLNSAKKVSPGMQLLLSKMVLAGNRLVLTSGRALPSVLKVAKNAGLLFPDISMLQAAGTAVAMANATPEVKACADFITQQDNDHDGLSEAILQLFEM